MSIGSPVHWFRCATCAVQIGIPGNGLGAIGDDPPWSMHMWPSARRSSARSKGHGGGEMRKRLVALMLVVLTVMLVTAMTPARLRGQGAARPQGTLTLPRTPDG